MSHVIFLRGANIGGHRVFRPAELVKTLPRLDLVNLGAAGTFVARAKANPKTIQSAFVRTLPFKTDVIVRPVDEIVRMVEKPPFGTTTPAKDVKWFVTVLAGKPAIRTRLPLDRPQEGPWQVRILRVEWPYVFSLWRREGKRLLYPNEVVEKALGIPATTRGWNTIVALRDIVQTS